MDPSLNSGERKGFTDLDFGGLVDVGWSLLPLSHTIDVAGGLGHTIDIDDNLFASDFRFLVTIDGTATSSYLVPSDVLTINGADGDDVITFSGLDAEFAAGTDDAHRDLAPVGDEQALNHAPSPGSSVNL